MPLDESQRSRLVDLTRKGDVVLFMKGNRQFPACGFSATVVGILKQLGTPFETVNILEDADVRQGMKELSGWPTFPQLYVRGEFIGGCDIVKEMSASGELAKTLGVPAQAASAPAKPPKITITPAAAKAFADAAADTGGEVLRLEIAPSFDADLHVGERQPTDLAVTSAGVTLHVAASSAARAEGLVIDFVEGPQGGAFRLDNPNAPPRVKSLSPKELADKLSAKAIELFDVRPHAERQLASIDAARTLDDAGEAHLASLAKDAPIALHCHHGMRSRRAAEALLSRGYTNVYNLEGGIDRWSLEVDPKVPRY